MQNASANVTFQPIDDTTLGVCLSGHYTFAVPSTDPDAITRKITSSLKKVCVEDGGILDLPRASQPLMNIERPHLKQINPVTITGQPPEGSPEAGDTVSPLKAAA